MDQNNRISQIVEEALHKLNEQEPQPVDYQHTFQNEEDVDYSGP